MSYKAVLFAPDGEWVTDCPGGDIEDVIEQLCNLGSRWIFFPFHAIIRDNGLTTRQHRLVDVAEPFEHMKGCTINTFSRMISQMPESELEDILRG